VFPPGGVSQSRTMADVIPGRPAPEGFIDENAVQRSIDVTNYAGTRFLLRGKDEVNDGKVERSKSSVTSRMLPPPTPRDPFPAGADKSIEWYPGHVATLMKEKKKNGLDH